MKNNGRVSCYSLHAHSGIENAPGDAFKDVQVADGFACGVTQAGNLRGHYAVWVSANWRVTFRFDEDGNAADVDYTDYH